MIAALVLRRDRGRRRDPVRARRRSSGRRPARHRDVGLTWIRRIGSGSRAARRAPAESRSRARPRHAAAQLVAIEPDSARPGRAEAPAAPRRHLRHPEIRAGFEPFEARDERRRETRREGLPLVRGERRGVARRRPRSSHHSRTTRMEVRAGRRRGERSGRSEVAARPGAGRRPAGTRVQAPLADLPDDVGLDDQRTTSGPSGGMPGTPPEGRSQGGPRFRRRVSRSGRPPLRPLRPRRC